MPIGRLLRLLPTAVAALLATASALLVAIRVEPTLDLPAEISARDARVVRVLEAGRVAGVDVEPGQVVAVGDRLAVLEDPAADRELRELRTELRHLDRRMDQLEDERRRLDRQDHAAEIDRARSRLEVRRLEAAAGASLVDQASLDLEAARQRLERHRRLEAAGLLSDAALEEQRFAVESLDRQLAQRRTEAKILDQRTALEARELKQLRRRQALRLAELDDEIHALDERRRPQERTLRDLEDAAARREVRAESAGVIVGAREHDLSGRWLQAGDELLTILDPESIELLARAPEEALVRLETGDPVRVEIAGLPRQRYGLFDGRVADVSPTPEGATGAGASGSGATYRVDIELVRPWVDLDGERFYLRPGMTGRAEVSYRGRVSLGRRLMEALMGE